MNVADLYPGQNLVIAFANFNDTNEDSIIVSSGSIGRSLFEYMGYSANVVNSNEVIPEVGKYAHIQTNRWWKSYSLRHMDNNNGVSEIFAEVDGRGKVLSLSNTQSGQISVKVLRHSAPVTGDKLASGHGQKGVMKIWNEADMPWGIDDRGNVIKFDMIMSLSSVTNRITAGLYYEIVSGVDATRTGKRIVVEPDEYHDKHEETVLYDGKTGELLMRTSEEERCDIPILSSWGIGRVWQMTQLSWDKQHYVHSTAGKYSITTSIGRTAGGGVKFGEMETHAAEASGLTEPVKELKSRIDLITVKLCTNCNETLSTCVCGLDQKLVPLSIPHSMLVFGDINVLTNGYVPKYKITF